MGLCPPDVVLADGNPLILNKGQQYLYQCWQHLLEVSAEVKPDILIINGDLVDGEQRRSLGKEALSTMVTAQQKAAVSLLAPLARTAKEVYVIHGSAYHDGAQGEFVEPIAEQLGAVGEHEGWHARPFLDLDVDGVLINVQHGIGTASGFYQSTPLDKEAMWSVVSGVDHDRPKADLIIRAHIHRFVHLEFPRRHVVVLPAWQLQTAYMRRRSYYRMLPDVGAVLFDIFPEAKRVGEDPIVVRKLLYTLPPIVPAKSKVVSDGEA
jgi:predicted phosphodiesterase